MKCSVCGKRYEAANVNVLSRQEDMWFLSVFCSSCRTHGLVAAVVTQGKPAPLETDLTEAEYSNFSNRSAVGTDDVLDIHNFLKDFSGHFADLFSKG